MFTATDMPKPIAIDGLAPLHKKRTTAGTKGKCIICGRKTYRYVACKPVCSYCSSNEKVDKIGPSWTRDILHREPSMNKELEDAAED